MNAFPDPVASLFYIILVAAVSLHFFFNRAWTIFLCSVMLALSAAVRYVERHATWDMSVWLPLGIAAMWFIAGIGRYFSEDKKQDGAPKEESPA